MKRNSYLFLFISLFALCTEVQGQTGIITTIAGSGPTGVSGGTFNMAGNGGPATAATLGEPWGVAADGAGNIYYSDHYSARIIKISPAGIITNFAGTGAPGYSGDGGPATAAALSGTFGVAADPYGNVYIAGGSGNAVIRKVSPSGIITTVAGTGVAGYSGDYGPATAAKINYAYGVAIDGAGNIFIADLGNNRIRKVNTSGIITTYAGNGTLGFAGDGGPANLALLDNPYGVAADAAGNVYIADIGNYRIRKVNTGGVISTLAGNGSAVYGGDGGMATAAGLPNVWGVAVDGVGNVYIPDHTYHRIRLINTAGFITSFAGDGTSGFFGDGGPSTSAKITDPIGVGVDGAGNVYIPDLHNARIRKVSGHDHPPVFLSGHSLHLTICGNTTGDSVNSLLSVHDSDLYQQERWSLISGPSHGVAVMADTLITMGDTLHPSGLFYSPASGYSGNDSFKIRITDGIASDTTTIYVTVLPAPGPITGSTLLCAGVPSAFSNTMTGGVWSSASPGIAAIGSLTGIVNGLATGTTVLSYTLSSGCAAIVVATVSPLPPAITGSMLVCQGQTTALADSITGGTWVSTNTAVAVTGSATGVVTGIAAGTSPVTYTTPGGCIRSVVVTVSPLSPIVPGSTIICSGNSVLLTDSASGGTWSSPGYSSVVSVGSSSGIVTGVGAGAAIISYVIASTGCTATMTMTVNTSPAGIVGVPHACLGISSALYDATSGGVWLSVSPGIATVGSSSGMVTGITTGISIISYMLPSGCAASMPVTVGVSPSAITGFPGICMSHSTLFSDTLSGGNWSGSNYLVAYIDPSSGVATGITYGTATITYTMSGGCYRTLNITVNPVPALITGGAPFCAGSTLPLYDGIAGGMWISGSPGIATVGSSTGIVTGVSGGNSIITYSMGAGCDATLTVSVSPLPAPITGITHTCEGGGTSTLSDATAGGVWSSGYSGTAIIGSATGALTGVTAGVVVISYTSGAAPGCSTTTLITVNPMPMPVTGTVLVCPGLTDTLIDSTGGGIWVSGNSTIASVGSVTGIVTGVAGGTTGITYLLPTGCGTNIIATVNPAPTIILGFSTVCVSGVITLSDGSTGGTWSGAGLGGIVSVGSSSGIVTGISGGPAIVTYTLPAGCFATKTVTVNTSPGAIGGMLKVCQGATTSLTDPASGGVWSSGSLGIATIGSATGIVTGVSTGIAGITYSAGTGCSATAWITVNPLPATFTVSGGGSYCSGGSGMHIFLSGSNTGVSYQLILGGTATGTPIAGTGGPIDFGLQTLTGTYTVIATTSGSGCTRTMTGSAAISINPLPGSITGPGALCVGAHMTETDGGTGTWTSGTTSVATIGLSTGIVTGVSFGTTLITYTLSTGCSVTRMITVSTTPVAISGGPGICVGAPATLTDSISGGVWNTASGLISVGSVSGVVMGVSTGLAVITYSLGTGCTTTTTLTVSPAPAVIAGTMQVCAGSNTTLTDPATGGVWSSGTPGIATIGSTSGTVNGVNAGTTIVSYTVSTGCAATAMITVNPLPANISGVNHVCPALTATLSDATPGGSWSSPAFSGIVSVGSASGVVTGVSSGTAIITYTLPTGCMTTSAFTVNTVPAAITGEMETCIGSSASLHDATTGGVWSSVITAVGTINPVTGVLSGITVGTTTISYVAGGCAAMAIVTVNPLPGSITGPGHVCVGSTITLTDPPGGGTWSSGMTGIAGIGSATGVVTGVAMGNATITYNHGAGCTSTTVVTVDALPAPISGSGSVCIGGTTTLSDVTTAGAWSSSGTSGIVSVGSASGIVNGLTGGTAIISYTIPTGCASTITVTVITVPPVTGLHNLCAWGDTLYVNDANPTGSYSSTLVTVTNLGTGNGRVTAFGPGLGTITYTLSSGCSLTTTFTINPLPGPITGIANLCAGSTTTFTDTSAGGVWSSGMPGIAGIGSSSGFLTAISGGSTRITYTIATGCKADTPVIVSTYPVAGTISGPTDVCTGSSITLTDTVTGGSWGSSNANATVAGGVVTGVAAGVDTINYAVTNVCGTASAYKAITIYPMPDAGVITGTDSVCTGNSVLLHDAASGGTWSCANTLASVSATGMVTGVTAGMDTVYYTVSNAGCSRNAMLPVKVIGLSNCGALALSWPSPTLPPTAPSLEKREGVREVLRVWPNPSDGAFVVNVISDVDEPVNIVVTNVIGERVYSVCTRTNKVNEIKLTKAGIYLVTVVTGRGNHVVRVVVE